MSGDIYITNPGETVEFVLADIQYRLSQSYEADHPGMLSVTVKNNIILQGAKIRFFVDGAMVFRGFVLRPYGDVFASERRYDCISRIGAAKRRYAVPYRYSAGHPDEAGSLLNLSEVLSSGAPSQSAGASQYVMGLIWLINSLVPSGLGTWNANGVWHYEGLGSASRGSNCAVYYDGHLCADAGGGVYSETTLKSSNYQFWRDAKHLYVYGTGEGDTFGIICIHNAFDGGLRLGDISSDDNIKQSVDLAHDSLLGVLRDLVARYRMYINVRDEMDYTYIDLVSSAPGRGSEDASFLSLDEDDLVSWYLPPAQDPPYRAVVGTGANPEYAEGAKYSTGSFVSDLAWMEDINQINGDRITPWGSLDATVDDRWADCQRSTELSISTHVSGILPGDWVSVDLGHVGAYVLRVDSVVASDKEPCQISFSGRTSTIEAAFYKAALSEAIEGYETTIYGEETREDNRLLRRNPDQLVTPVTPIHIIADSVNNRIVKRNNSDLSYVAQEGDAGEADPFSGVAGGAIDEDHIYLADTSNNRIVKCLKSDMSFVSKIGSVGGGDDQFRTPRSIAVDDNYLYVADRMNHRIVKRLKSDLSFVMKIGSQGHGDDQFDRPAGIAVDEEHLYICDNTNSRLVKRLKSDLSYVSEIGEQGSGNDSFYWPLGIADDGTHLYICDNANHRLVKRLKSDLSFVAKIGSYGVGDDQFKGISGIATDGTHLYVTDYDNDRVVKRKCSDLSYVSEVGSTGGGQDQFNMPLGTATLLLPFYVEFVTKNYGADPALVLFTLESSFTDTEVDKWSNLPVWYQVIVNEVVVAIFWNKPPNGTVIKDLDITAACKLDGTKEVLLVYSGCLLNIDEGVRLTYAGTVRGIDNHG